MSDDDEIVERLRRALHTEAGMLTPGHGTPRVTPVSARPRRRLGRNGGYVVLAAVAVVVAIVVITSNLGHHHSRVDLAVGGPTTSSSRVTTRPKPAHSPIALPTSTTTPPTSTTSTVAATTTPVPPPTTRVKGPVITPVAADFVPLSATFVTADDGWVLGVEDCRSLSPCLKVDVTADRGTTWRAEAGPAVAGLTLPTAANQGARPDLQVRFATSEIGWIFGTVAKAPVVYWSDDGGASWQPDALPARFDATRIEDIETAAGRVQMAFLTRFGGVAVATASVALGAPTWVESAVKIAGPATAAQLVIQGNAGWLVALDGTTVAGGARIVGTTWESWSPPCGATSGPALLAASTPRNVIAVCGRAGHQELYVSANAGITFAAELSLGSLDVTSVSSGEAASALFATSQGTVASLMIPTKALTTPDPPAAASGQSVVQIGFEDGAQGLLITATPRAGALYLTSSAGRTWDLVKLGG